MLLSKLGEFNLIKKFRTSFAKTSSEIITGIGDDAAAISQAKKDAITLITTDMLIEGVHFDLSYTTFYQLGYKALAVNISDIFAMGGKPKHFLVGLGIPKDYDSGDIDELYSGIKSLAKKFAINIIGGDTCASRHGLVLSGTLTGETKRVITRSGAKPGDSIFVTDTLGDSAMGLMLLKKMGNKKWEIRNKKFKLLSSKFSLPTSHLRLIRRHLMPEIAPLKNTGGITSMIDISDGLLIDLSHICDESNAGARIYMDKIPVSQELIETAERIGVNYRNFALKGGEDYALLFTAPANIKIKACRLGEITKKGRFIVDEKGRERPLKAEGYEHFKDSEQSSVRLFTIH
ncbi:MAG: thiamine-phosphate kinase [Nitrospirae bacterium]|nr:thiamine-phosphate kinase [Nitrospirota bacterium]